MRKAGGLLAFFSGLYGVLAAVVTLVVLGGIGSTLSADPVGVSIAWAGLVLSVLISGLGLACMRTEAQRPVFFLLLAALVGFLISETLVSICMVGAFLSGVLAANRALPSLSERNLAVLPLAPSLGEDTLEGALPIPEHSSST